MAFWRVAESITIVSLTLIEWREGAVALKGIEAFLAVLITLWIGLLTVLRISAVIIGCLTVMPLAWGQGRLEIAISPRADVVVIGTLHQSVKFPWIDGWNERGYIEVERILKGTAPEGRLSFAWERDFLQGCIYRRPDWRGAVGRRGIWVLTRDGNRYRAPDVFFGFIEPDSLTEVIGLLAGKSK